MFRKRAVGSVALLLGCKETSMFRMVGYPNTTDGLHGWLSMFYFIAPGDGKTMNHLISKKSMHYLGIILY